MFEANCDSPLIIGGIVKRLSEVYLSSLLVLQTERESQPTGLWRFGVLF
jgi:hypothetical protein